jgi:antitoxin (DNA-binding transcriptional repressor) of toxin-antitoxin stability system
MKTVSIRDLTHHMGDHIKEIQGGERIVVLYRNVPVAEMIPYRENVQTPGWKRPVNRLKNKKKSFLSYLESDRYDG